MLMVRGRAGLEVRTVVVRDVDAGCWLGAVTLSRLGLVLGWSHGAGEKDVSRLDV